MKTAANPFVLLVLACVSLLFAGCGGGSAKTKMDTTEFTAAFSAADASLKGPAEEAVKALKAGKLFEGATGLAALAKSGAEKLSQEQKNAMINLGSTIQMVMSEDGNKADLKVYQAVEDLMAALTEREASQVGITPDRVKPAQSQGK